MQRLLCARAAQRLDVVGTVAEHLGVVRGAGLPQTLHAARARSEGAVDVADDAQVPGERLGARERLSAWSDATGLSSARGDAREVADGGARVTRAVDAAVVLT